MQHLIKTQATCHKHSYQSSKEDPHPFNHYPANIIWSEFIFSFLSLLHIINYLLHNNAFWCLYNIMYLKILWKMEHMLH